MPAGRQCWFAAGAMRRSVAAAKRRLVQLFLFVRRAVARLWLGQTEIRAANWSQAGLCCGRRIAGAFYCRAAMRSAA